MSSRLANGHTVKLILLPLLWLAACNAPPQPVQIPPPYRGISPPTPNFITDAGNLKAGRALYHRHCAVCHGPTGRGDGPAGRALSLKPANLANPLGVAQQPLDYWFWRVSEGGTAEPFHSRKSVMPAWKYHLTAAERWQVIAFARTLSDPAANPYAPGEGGANPAGQMVWSSN